jgi:hypothetical protein
VRLGVAPAPAVFPFGVARLQEGRVLEQELEQVARRRRHVNGAGVAGAHELGQQAGMVEMRVRHDHGVERARVEGEGALVQALDLRRSLEQAAFEQHPGLGGLDQVAGTGDLAGAAEERERWHAPSVAACACARPARRQPGLDGSAGARRCGDHDHGDAGQDQDFSERAGTIVARASRAQR